jgi:hypothetical protein
MRMDVDVHIRPEHLQNVYFAIIAWLVLFAPFFWFFVFSNEKPAKVLIFAVFAFSIGVLIFSIYLRHFYRNSVYLTMTPQKLVGYNHFNKFKGEVRWDEIVEMYSTEGTYYIMLKDKNGKVLRTGAPLADFKSISYKDENGNDVIEKTDYHNYEIVLNEIIKRAVNCKKIDFKTIKKKFPRIIVYEKGI